MIPSKPGLAVIVITLNEEAHIREVLQRITRSSGLDDPSVVVVDGGSRDRTVEIAGQYAEVVATAPGRGRQMTRGLEEVSEEVVIFCHGDTLLPEGFGLDVLRACSDPEVVGGAFRPVYRPAHPVLTAASWVLRIPSPYLVFGDQAIFARRSDLEAVGGVPEHSLMEDVSLALKLAGQGKFVRIPREVMTSSRRFLERGPVRQLLLDIRLLIRYHLLGHHPERLAQAYQVTSRDVGPEGETCRVGLGLMAKAPLPGHAKTRLAASVGEERAAEIYGSILKQLLERFSRFGDDILRVIFAAEDQDASWFRERYPVWEVRVQAGVGLGERLERAAESLFKSGADRAFLTAADVPGFQPMHLIRGIQILEDHDLVLGPSPDGGYYLIGMKQVYPAVLEDIPWGEESVLEATLQKAEAAGLSSGLLPPLTDIDTRKDWEQFQQRQNRGD